MLINTLGKQCSYVNVAYIDLKSGLLKLIATAQYIFCELGPVRLQKKTIK